MPPPSLIWSWCDMVVKFAPSIKFAVAVYMAEVTLGFLILLYLLSR
jgi:hypothetical protein